MKIPITSKPHLQDLAIIASWLGPLCPATKAGLVQVAVAGLAQAIRTKEGSDLPTFRESLAILAQRGITFTDSISRMESFKTLSQDITPTASISLDEAFQALIEERRKGGNPKS